MPRRWMRSNAARPARRCPGAIRIPAATAPSFPVPAYHEAGRNCRSYHPHHLYRRPAADRARHRLPQSGRHLDADRLSRR